MSEQITEILTFLTVGMAGEAVVTWVENGHFCPWEGLVTRDGTKEQTDLLETD